MYFIPYALLDQWAKFPDFEMRIRNHILLQQARDRIMIGFNGFMWSQAVIVEVYTLSALSLTGVLCCLLRWIYAPHQRRYLYLAFFFFGICFNNHQSLLVIALALTRRRLLR